MIAKSAMHSSEYSSPPMNFSKIVLRRIFCSICILRRHSGECSMDIWERTSLPDRKRDVEARYWAYGSFTAN